MKNILVPVDGSAFSEKIARKGYELAKAVNGEIALLHVVDPELAMAPEGYAGEDLISQFKKEAEGNLYILRNKLGDENILLITEVGHPAKVILQVAREWKADMIVIGTHGRTGLSHLLMGSVAEHVIRHTNIPILVITPGSH
jgi:nucleotide-binding universal stress UspA family protein